MRQGVATIGAAASAALQIAPATNMAALYNGYISNPPGAADPFAPASPNPPAQGQGPNPVAAHLVRLRLR